MPNNASNMTKSGKTKIQIEELHLSFKIERRERREMSIFLFLDFKHQSKLSVPGQTSHIQSSKKFSSAVLNRDDSETERLKIFRWSYTSKRETRISKEKSKVLRKVQQFPAFP